jgi:ubiquitin-small subunit ribosomal protein S27Ae
MGRKQRKSKVKEKHHRVHRENKGPLFEVKDGKVIKTHRECPRCGAGVFMAPHYARFSCGKCGYTKFDTPKAATATDDSETGPTSEAATPAITGVAVPKRTRKPLQK